MPRKHQLKRSEASPAAARLLPPHHVFSDQRGVIRGIFNSFEIRESNLITSEPDVHRGDHYHKETTEILHILDGEVRIVISKKDEPGEERYTLTPGDSIVIYPGEIHSSHNSVPSRWLNFLTTAFDPDNPDIHRGA